MGETPGHQFACFYPVGEAEKGGRRITTAFEPTAGLAGPRSAGRSARYSRVRSTW